MPYYTDFDADWLHWIAPERFNDADLFRIVTFFVFHSPCLGLSSMGKTLMEYGWNTPWRKPFWLNKQLKQAASNDCLLFTASKYDYMETALVKADLYDSFPSDVKRERICVYDNKRNQFMSVFYHLRDSFAHGRLNMIDIQGDCIFVLEDVVKKQKKNEPIRYVVSARMIIKKSTLLKWINIIEGGEKEFVMQDSQTKTRQEEQK